MGDGSCLRSMSPHDMSRVVLLGVPRLWRGQATSSLSRCFFLPCPALPCPALLPLLPILPCWAAKYPWARLHLAWLIDNTYGASSFLEAFIPAKVSNSYSPLDIRMGENPSSAQVRYRPNLSSNENYSIIPWKSVFLC